jgi:uncharacterized cupredoxin-like copper-binding protein
VKVEPRLRRLSVPRKLLVALAVIAIPLFLAACGDDDDTTATSAATPATTSADESTQAEADTTASSGGGGDTVDLSETEYKITPADPSVKAGSVTFDITNDGATVHNIEIEGNGVEEESDDLQPGDNGQLTVDLEPGTYEMYCSIDGHEDLGMKGEITVP